jgi:hypothetical protein
LEEMEVALKKKYLATVKKVNGIIFELVIKRLPQQSHGMYDPVAKPRSTAILHSKIKFEKINK